ncbi:hypothetical protein ACT6QG_01125 [Xanthobacter sp. TB0136]|uniref:hypothetical protein n=1 Tax=Xanthobacter sp. TB0136 TaxID=3459177 RepID=UPI0040398A69
MRAKSPFSREAALMLRSGRKMDTAESPVAQPRKATSRILAGSAGALCLLLAAAQPASADEFNTNPMRSMMDLFGLSDDEPKPEIDYRERAPLVVPPGTLENLPTPQESAHKQNPAWPKDPDVARRAREAAEANKPIKRDDPGRHLLPSELNKGRTQSGLLGNLFKGGGQAPGEDPDNPRRMLPSQLGFGSWLTPNKQEPIAFTGEPERHTLTQPPPGYLTPAPNAPYGVVEEKQSETGLGSLFRKKTPND